MAIPMLLSFGLAIYFLWRSDGSDWDTVKFFVCLGLSAVFGTFILRAFHEQQGWPEDKE
jgi:hypothetical protein